MKKSITTIKCHLSSRLSLLFVMLIGFVATAMADKLTIKDFSIKPGETKTVAVEVETDKEDCVTSLEFNIQLPEGLEYVSCKQAGRSSGATHSLSFKSVIIDKDKGIYSKDTYFCYMLTKKGTPITGKEGAVILLTLKASENFTANARIRIYNCLLSRNDSPDGKPSTKPEDSNVKVSEKVATIGAAQTSIAIKPNGTQKVEVTMKNDVKVQAVAADIWLPKGMAIPEENGFESSSRLAENYDILSGVVKDNDGNPEEGHYRVIISSLDGDDMIQGFDGTLFSFTVKVGETIAEDAEIQIGSLNVSVPDVASGKDVSYGPYEDVATVAVTNYEKVLAPALAKLNAIQIKRDEAVARVDAAHVEYTEADKAALAAIDEAIARMKNGVNDSYEKMTLEEDMTAIFADYEKTEAAIEKFVEDALAAKKAANEAAYKVFKAKLDDVKALLSNVKANIKLNCKDVAAAFEETVNAIETQFAAMADSLELMYKKVELTAETSFDLTKLEADIVKLDADSKAAQAKWTANETAQETVNTVLMRVMDALNEADATISEQCPNVGTAYLDKLAEVATQVNQIGMEVSEKYSAVELTAEAADAYVQALNKLAERIQAIVDEAVKAEQGTTGIKAVMGGNAQGVKIYTLAGQAVAAPVKGQVNVFKFADGTVKKMYVR